MTHRISDERLREIQSDYQDGSEAFRLFAELEQSRALISQLRELAVEMDNSAGTLSRYYAKQLDSLLSAHGAQGEKQADGEGKSP